MADHLILSLQPPRFLIFSSFPHRLWGISKRFPGRVTFSVPDFRLASQLQSANSTTISQSASTKFDLVSSTQLPDGSHIFRFGDASEIERNLETGEKESCVDVEEHQSKVVEEASEISTKQGVKDHHTLRHVSEMEGSNKNSDSKINTVSMNYDRATPAKHSNVIKIKDRKRARSPTKKKRETLTSVNVSQNEDKGETKLASVSNPSSIVSVPETIQTSSTKEKVFVSGESETINENGIRDESYRSALQTNDRLSSDVTEKDLVNEIGNCEPNNYKQINEKRLEVEAKPRSSSSRPGSQTCDRDEVAQKMSTVMVMDESPVVCDHTLDVKDNPMEFIEAGENLFVELTSSAAISSDEPISTSEATHPSIDEKPTSDTSDMATKPEDIGNAASTMEDEKAASDTKIDDGNVSKTFNETKSEDLQLSAPDMASRESIEVASWSREEVVSAEFYLDSGLASLQSPLKALAGREDAYFISQKNWLGIADGVSQWSLEGINSGKYAQELMNNCQKIISDEASNVTDPVQVLQRSVSETKSPGSSTALIAYFDKNELHIANIGDSGFMVIRKGTILHKSSPMVLYFYFPLQITQGDDALKLAEIYNVDLDEGDVVITATDGLFDNLYEKDIASIVCRALEQSLEPQKIAELVAAKALEMGRSKTAKTPFADAAKEEGFDGYIGGRLDAVTVIVSLVKTLSI